MLKRNKLILSAAKNLILISIFFGTSIYAQSLDKELRIILEMKDSRTIGKNSELLKNLNSNDPKIATASAWALSNISDTMTIKYIGEALTQSISSISEDKNSLFLPLILSFSLGQMNSSEGNEFLINALNLTLGKKINEIPQLLAEIMISLSKTGNEDELNRLLDLQLGDNQINSAIAMAIARFGLRKIKNDGSYLKLAELMEQTKDSTVRRNIAFAFNRIADKQTLIAYNTELMTSSTSPDPFARMWGFSALGKEQDTSFIPYFLESLEKEIDWRVQVNIINAIGNLKIDLNSPELDKTVASLLQFATQDPSTHVSIVALQALGKLFAGADIRNPQVRKIQQDIQFILTPGKAIDWQIKAEAIRTYAKIFKDNVKDELLSLFNQTDNYDIKSAIVGSFGSMNIPLVYKELRDSISADVQRYNVLHPNKDGSMIGSPDLAKLYRAFVDALTELDDKLDDGNRNIIRLILSEFSSSKDPILADNCLTNLQDSMYMQYRAETCQIMTFDYNALALPKDRDVALMYIQAWDAMKYDDAKEILTANLKSSDYDIAIASANALKNITGKNYEKEITAPKYRTDFDWGFIDKLGEKKFATINTNKGIIKIVLLTENAPFTVQNFVKLSEKGYYNNTIFHRVVPNFVIQGGDPTGTGYGGPGYSIRSEFSPLPFDAYTVGMASSGKDTEGSQFFITHSPQPHLDGKYTLFGSVVDGFDVVDNIQIGDVIESVTFSSH